MNKYLIVVLLSFELSICHCASVQKFSSNLSIGSDAFTKGITNAGRSMGNMISGIKDIFDDTNKRINEQEEDHQLLECNKKFQQLNQDYHAAQDKYKTIYDYVHKELINIVGIQNDANLNKILEVGIQTDKEGDYLLDKFQFMLDSTLKLLSIWQSITQLSTPEQVNQFLMAHTTFYNKIGNRYVENSVDNRAQNIRDNELNGRNYNSQNYKNDRGNLNNYNFERYANGYNTNSYRNTNKPDMNNYDLINNRNYSTNQYTKNQKEQSYSRNASNSSTTNNLPKYIMKKIF